MTDPPQRVVLRSNGTTTCCNAMTTIDQDSFEEYCKGCYRPVQLRIVKHSKNSVIMIAGATPCGIPERLPTKRKPRKKNTARHGRGKAKKR